MLKFVIPVVGLAVVAAFFYVGLGLERQPLPSPLIGKPMPEFSLPRLKDPERQLSRSDLEGGVSLLNVWGEWCPQCRIEHPFLMELARTGRVPIFGLDLKDERPLALAWLARLGDPYAVIGFDEEGEAAIDWGIYGAPETFLIGPEGTVRHKLVGVMTPEVWREEFEPLIDEICGDDPCPLPAILREPQ